MARLPAVPVAESMLVLRGATIIDGLGSQPFVGDVEVCDGRISYVGPPRVTPAGTADLVVDLAGAYLLPGLIDAHVHLTMPNDSTDAGERGKFVEEHAFATAASMRATVAAGVTTVRDLSGLTPGYRNAVAAGLITGPRMHMSISMLSPTGGHADPVQANGSLPGYVNYESVPSWAVVDSDTEILRAVRTAVRTGADVIKVCTTGGISTPTDSPDDLGLSQRQVEVIVAELAVRGKQPVAAHAQGIEGALHAVRGGVSSLEHGYEMTDELIGEMLQRGTVLVPTLSTLYQPPDPGRSSAETVAKKKEWQARGARSAAMAIAAGVPIVLGTDAGIHPQGKNLTELGHLVGAGLSPLEAIRSGTSRAAKLLGLESQIGSIEVGKQADLVVTALDPVHQIEGLADPANIAAVLMSGRCVKDLPGIFPTLGGAGLVGSC